MRCGIAPAPVSECKIRMRLSPDAPRDVKQGLSRSISASGRCPGGSISPSLRTRILASLDLLAFFSVHLRANDVERISDIIYTKHDGVALTMEVFKPAKPNVSDVIKIISGGWKSNHKGISDGG